MKLFAVYLLKKLREPHVRLLVKDIADGAAYTITFTLAWTSITRKCPCQQVEPDIVKDIWV